MARKTTNTTTITGKEKSKKRTIAESALYLAKPGQSAAGLDEYQPPKEKKKKKQATPTAPEEKKERPDLHTVTEKFDIAEIMPELLRRISDGESLRSYCRDKNYQLMEVVQEISKFPEFSFQYAHARELSADYYFDQILQTIADCQLTPEAVQLCRVKVDALKWICGKLHPRRYSDKAQIEVSGANGAPLTIAAASVNIEQLNALREQLNAAIDITAEELPQ